MPRKVRVALIRLLLTAMGNNKSKYTEILSDGIYTCTLTRTRGEDVKQSWFVRCLFSLTLSVHSTVHCTSVQVRVVLVLDLLWCSVRIR